jgi:ActR/RegA family two-component response regulator
LRTFPFTAVQAAGACRRKRRSVFVFAAVEYRLPDKSGVDVMKEIEDIAL